MKVNGGFTDDDRSVDFITVMDLFILNPEIKTVIILRYTLCIPVIGEPTSAQLWREDMI